MYARSLTQKILTIWLGVSLLVGLALGLLPAQPALAARLCYVNAAALGANTGDGWSDAYTDLQSALGASTCTEVWVAGGVYKPTAGTDRFVTFQLKQGVALYGGFDGSESQRDQRDWTAHVTTLSGDIGLPLSNIDNSMHVVTGADNAILDGFTITAGNASDPFKPGMYHGGGMLNTGGSPTLTNLVFYQNLALSGGGGLYNSDGSPALSHVIFQENKVLGLPGFASPMGGGMETVGGSPVLTDVMFIGNAANWGGGLYNDGSLTMNRVAFIDNYGNLGGDMAHNGGSAALTNVTYYNSNWGTLLNGSGGGLYSTNAVVLTNATFIGSGLRNILAGTITLRNSIVTSACTIGAGLVDGGGNLFTQACGALPANTTTLALNLGPLADNGGVGYSFALLPGSSAIDAARSNCPTDDQRGQPRSTPCDSGAYEYHPQPFVVTLPASQVAAAAATLHGRVNPNGSAATVGFEYGLTDSYGSSVTAAQSPVIGTADIPVSAALTGLAPGTTYHYRAVGENSGGAANGEDQTFTTLCSSAITVTSSADSGAGSLRQAMDALCAGGTITFNASLADQTITLTSGELFIDRSMTVDGGTVPITVSGGSAVRVFHVGAGLTFNLNKLTVANGLAGADLHGGGGMWVDGTNVTTTTVSLSHVAFRNNQAGIAIAEGGGSLRSYQGNLALTDVTFADNQALTGGGLSLVNSTAAITNATFSGNQALQSDPDQYGCGALYSGQSHLALTNATFANNTGINGGAFCKLLGGATLTHVTFNDNNASQSGGAIFHVSNAGSLTLANSILWDNPALDDTQISDYDAAAVVIDSVIQNGYPAGGTNILTADPLLGALGDYGGDAQTIPLRPGSSAIDAGNAAYCTLGHDQRGISYAGACDIGAFESQGFRLTKAGGDGQSTGIDTAFTNPLSLTVAANDPLGLEPVIGGLVIFTPPASGASAIITGSPATIGAGGAASVTAAANGAAGGPYTVVASTSGASSVNFNLTNAKGSTTTTLTASPNPSTYGQSVTFTATVSISTTSGTVTFKDSGATISGCAAQTLAAGQTTCTTAALGAGAHPNLTAVYSGDTNYNGSTSSPYAQTVNQATATINLSNLTQTYDGAPKPVSTATVPLELTVAITYTGSSGTTYGPSTTAPVNAGTYRADAVIHDANYQGASNDTLNLIKADTTIRLLAAPNPSIYGQPVTLTVTITSSIAGGTVAFQDDSLAIPGCEAQALTGGQAVCTTSALALGMHTLTAGYSGDANHNGSASDPLTQVVNKAAVLDVMLSKTVRPLTVAPGEAITFTLAFTNTGSLPAAGILLTDSFPAFLWGASFTSTVPVTDTNNISPFVWQVHDLAPGQGGLITIRSMLTVPLAEGTYTNTAYISAAGDLLAENNTATITFTVPNIAPVFTSVPVVTATVGAPYTYTITPQDSNGDALTITAPTLPAWLTIIDHGDGTATLVGTPASPGDYPVVLRVADRSGIFAEQLFTVTVSEKPQYRIFLPLVTTLPSRFPSTSSPAAGPPSGLSAAPWRLSG